MPDLKDSLNRYVEEETPPYPPPFSTVRVRARRRAHRHAIALSVGVVVLVAGSATVAVRQLDSHRVPAPSTAQATGPRSATTPAQAPSSSRTGAVPLGNSSLSCAESYNLQTLQGRVFAFEGTVVSLGPARSNLVAGPTGNPGYVGVTFKVNEWFRGGSAPRVTVDMFPPATTPTATRTGDANSGGGPSYDVGSRLLVSGEPRWGGSPLQDPVAFACGFTRYYDQQTANAWRQALAATGTSARG